MDNKFYKQAWFWIIIVAVVVAGGLLIYDRIDMDERRAAVQVNGEEVTVSQFENILTQVRNRFEMQGYAADSQEIFDEAVEGAVRQVLVSEYAREEGIEIDPEELEKEYEEMVEFSQNLQTKEQLLGQIKTEEGFEEDEVDEMITYGLKEQKLQENYEEKVNVEQEDIEEEYQDYKEEMEQFAPNQEVEDFEDVEEDIKMQLTRDEASLMFNETLEEMREEKEIEVLVEKEDLDVDLEMEEQPMPGGGDMGDMEIEMDSEGEFDEEELEEQLEELEEMQDVE